MITAHLPLRGMQIVPEMRSISALNLEPAVPKLDDVTLSKWITFKLQLRSSTTASPRSTDKCGTRSHQRSNLLSDFQQALEVFKRREATRYRQASVGRLIGEATAIDAGASEAEAAGTASSPSRPHRRLLGGAIARARPWLGVRDGGQPTEPQPPPQQGTAGLAATAALRRPPTESADARSEQQVDREHFASAILEPFLEQAQREHPSISSRQWPQATGPAYRMILGSPTGPGAEDRPIRAHGQAVTAASQQGAHPSRGPT